MSPGLFPPALLVQCAIALSLFIVAALLPPFPLFSDPRHYLPLHIALEFLGIAVALMIFTMGWFSFSHERGARFQILACAFLAVALLDFIHTLSYPGMPDLVTPSSVEKAINFWLPARIISALALLTAAVLTPQTALSGRMRVQGLAATLIIISGVIAAGLFLPDIAPRTFIDGQGLTPFKITVEYTVIALYGITLVLLIRGWRQERDRFRALLISGLWFLLLGELSLTLYFMSTDLDNLLGPVCKTWGDGFIFWAVYVQAMDDPHRRLRRSERLLAQQEAQTRALLQENQILLDSAFVGIVFVKDRHFIRVNRRTELLFGYDPGEMDGVSTEIIYPDHAAYRAMSKYAYPVIDQGELFAGEVELVHKDGSRFWCLMRGHTLVQDQRLDGFIWILEDVTELRRTRQALEDAKAVLQQSELRFRTLFTASKVAMLLVDPGNGDIIDANRAASDYYGYPLEQLRGMKVSAINILSPEQIIEEMSRAAQEERSHFLFQHRLASGEIRDVEVHSGPLELDHRPLLYSIIHDITDRRRLEEERRKLSQAVEQSPLSVVMTNLDGRIEYVNRQFLEITGYTLDEVLGQNPRVLKSGETSPEEYQRLWNAISHGQTWRGTFHNRKKNGELYWEQAQISPIFDEQGQITHYLGVKENITAQKSAQDALRDSEERLQRVLEGANDGFWDWNISTGEVLFSRRWAEMLGYDLAEIEPHIRTWEKLAHPDDLPRCTAALQAHFAGETPRYYCEHRMRTKSGAWCWIMDRGKVTARDAQGQPLRMAGTHTDISERRRVEEALRVSLAEVKSHDVRMIDLNRMNDLLLSCETREEAYQIIARSAGRLFAGSGGLAIIREGVAPELRVVAIWGDANNLPETFPLGHCWALRRGEIHEITHAAQSAHCWHFFRPPQSAYFCVPLTVRGETHGLLHVSAGEAQTEAQLKELRTLVITVSESIKLALSNIKLQEALREQAIRDPLTGLFNRRYLDETLPRELHRCRRQGEPLAAAMLDVDHFKRFNDSYGHEAGDAALRSLGDLLKRSLRASDIACRYGGEELTVILPGSTLNDAQARLDSLRRAIMQLRLSHQGAALPAITLSIGVAAAGEREVDAAALLARADAALYQAKAGGRNRVIAS